MSIVLLLLGCFILYSKSKFFPKNLERISLLINKQKKITTMVGYLFLTLSYILFKNKFGTGTALVLFIISIIFSYSVLSIVFTINKKPVYIIAIISLLIIIFNL